MLDPARQALLRAGVEIDLRPQSFSVLLVLISNRGRLVTKEQLHSDVWGSVAVTDSSITHCISDIRKALDDTDRIIVRTVPRRGFIFSADVAEVAVTEAAARQFSSLNQRRAVIGVVAAIILGMAGWWLLHEPRGDLPDFTEFPANSLAVLPFEGSKQTDTASGPYLGAAFSDELREQFERVRGLRVAASASSAAVVGLESDTRRMAGRLSVRYLLKGRFLQDGDDLRISAQLLEAESARTMWAQTFNVRPSGLLGVQQAISAQVAGQILPDSNAAAATSTTLNPTANELMLLARDKERQVRDRAEVDVPLMIEAVRLYRAAVEADPSSALAHSRLAGALLYLGDVRAAEVPILRALDLNPELSEVQDTLGKYYWARRMAGAGAAWKKAIELNPNNADALASYAWLRWMQSDEEGPIEYYGRALELDPLSLSRYGDLGNFLGTQGHVDETREILARVEAMFDSAESRLLIAHLFELIGEVDASIAMAIQARDMEPDNPSHVWRLAELYAAIGDFQTAGMLQPEPGVGLLFHMRRYQELVNVAEELMIDLPSDMMVRYLLAFGYNAIGEYAAAERILRLSSSPFAEPETVWHPAELEAFATLINAVDKTGNRQHAVQLARQFLSGDHIEHTDWWISTYVACAHAVLGEEDIALDLLERSTGSARLPWMPVLMDSPCFERLANEARYQAVVEHFEARRAALRRRLPETLDKYGVTL